MKSNNNDCIEEEYIEAKQEQPEEGGVKATNNQKQTNFTIIPLENDFKLKVTISEGIKQFVATIKFRDDVHCNHFVMQPESNEDALHSGAMFLIVPLQESIKKRDFEHTFDDENGMQILIRLHGNRFEWNIPKYKFEERIEIPKHKQNDVKCLSRSIMQLIDEINELKANKHNNMILYGKSIKIELGASFCMSSLDILKSNNEFTTTAKTIIARARNDSIYVNQSRYKSIMKLLGIVAVDDTRIENKDKSFNAQSIIQHRYGHQYWSVDKKYAYQWSSNRLLRIAPNHVFPKQYGHLLGDIFLATDIFMGKYCGEKEPIASFEDISVYMSLWSPIFSFDYVVASRAHECKMNYSIDCRFVVENRVLLLEIVEIWLKAKENDLWSNRRRVTSSEPIVDVSDDGKSPEVTKATLLHIQHTYGTLARIILLSTLDIVLFHS